MVQRFTVNSNLPCCKTTNTYKLFFTRCNFEFLKLDFSVSNHFKFSFYKIFYGWEWIKSVTDFFPKTQEAKLLSLFIIKKKNKKKVKQLWPDFHC